MTRRSTRLKCADTAPAFAGDPEYPYVGKLVHDLTLAQIHTLDCGELLKDFPTAEVVRGNKIATLPEVFALTDAHRADVRYNIETKVEAEEPETSAAPQEFVDVILAAVRAAGKTDKVEIQSFDWRTLPMVRAAEPSIRWWHCGTRPHRCRARRGWRASIRRWLLIRSPVRSWSARTSCRRVTRFRMA